MPTEYYLVKAVFVKLYRIVSPPKEEGVAQISRLIVDTGEGVWPRI